MELTSVLEKGFGRCEFRIKVSPKEFEAEVDRVFEKNFKRMTVPGFRRGKAPKALVERHYGKDFFFNEAFERILPKALDFAEKESGEKIIKGVEKMIVQPVSSDVKKGLEFTAETDIMPKFNIGEYKGFRVETKKQSITDEDVKSKIDEIRAKRSRLVNVDGRPAENGNVVNINFSGKIGDETLEKGSAENYNLVLGSGQFVSGFEEQIVGKNVGEEFDITITFPKEYPVQKLAGKPVVFKIKINAISERISPELNDEFVKETSNKKLNNVEEFEKLIRRQLEAQSDQKYDYEVSEELKEKLAALVPIDKVHKSLIEQRLDVKVKEFEDRAASLGVELAKYYEATGQTPEKVREILRPEAEDETRFMLALSKIAELEKLAIKEKEIKDKYDEISKAYGISVDKVREMIPEAEFSKEMEYAKAWEFVKTSAIYQ
jgi:trigger factor